MPRDSHARQAEAEQRDLYADLDVVEGATDAEIRRAFHELIIKVHPSDKDTTSNVMRPTAGKTKMKMGMDPDTATTAWAEFIRRMQASARGRGYVRHEDHRAHREYKARMEKERAPWKDLEQKRWKAAQEMREARAQDEKKLKMKSEETARDNAIAQEDPLHEKYTKRNKNAKQAASRKNCTCQGCRDRFVREQTEKDQQRKDPRGYAERMKIREAVAARKEKEVAKQAPRRHVPDAGIAVHLGWVSAGYAPACSFCKFKKMNRSSRCRQGGAVVCGRWKKSLGRMMPENEAVLLGAE
ncbi:hypothetical protein DPSP01_010761 [Paraphaeosphaeria sporulosa]